MAGKERQNESLPACVTEYINLVVRKIKYRRKVRQEVRQELMDHFADALAEYQTDPQRQQAAEKLIAEFGDPKTLATLIRRGKKRCRPLWKKAIIRCFQAVGLFVILFCFYTWWFVSGTPTIRVDYVAQLNQISRPEVTDEDNAWLHYEKAIELYVEPDDSIKDQIRILDKKQEGYKDFSQFTEAEQEKLLEWIKQNEPAWNEYVKGSQKTYCWIKYEAKDGWVLNIILPELGKLRGLTRMGIWQARLLTNQGQLDEAFEICLTHIRTGKHFQKEKCFLIMQLVGIAISKIGHNEIMALSTQTNIIPIKLIQIQKQLENIYKGNYPLVDIEGERFFFLDTVQRVFTDGGIGGGHLIPGEIMKIMDEPDGSDEKIDELMLYTAGGMIHMRRNETMKLGNQLYDEIEKQVKLTPYETYRKNINTEQKIKTLSEYRCFLVRYMVPALSRVGALAFEGKATHEATLTVLALRRRQMEKGTYPEELKPLVDEGYLQKLPDDPYSDGILRYEKREDDFTLYSLGRNFADDDGVQHPEVNFEWGDPEKVGDRVFWPVSQ